MADDDRTRTEKVIDHLKGRVNPVTVGKEIFATVTDKLLPHGSAELAQFLNTGSPYVLYEQGEKVEPLTGVHGAATPEVAEPTQIDVGTLKESAQLLHEEQWFDKTAAVERDNYANRTPAEREAKLDQLQGLAAATREASQESGVAPPLWASMNRQEMKEAVTPEKLPEQRTSSLSGQTAKDQFLARGPGLQATTVTEVGPPLATPNVKQPAIKMQQADPLAQARAVANERAKTPEKGKQIEI